MRLKKPTPWLTPTGVEIPTEKLKQVAQGWNRETWDDYLSWFESSLGVRVITPKIYELLSDSQTDSVFAQFDQNTDQRLTAKCDRLLASLPFREREVLRLLFIAGKTQFSVAAQLNLSQQRISQIKENALGRLRRGHQGNKLVTREYMGGECFSPSRSTSAFWTEKTPFQIKEPRRYLPENIETEIDNHPSSTLKSAMRGLTPIARAVLFRLFWCEQSVYECARELNTGPYVVRQICDSAISKFKRLFYEIETGVKPEGGQSCA